MKLTTEYESGTVYNFDACSVFVPADIDDPDDAAERARSLSGKSHPDGVVRIESDSGDLRSSTQRAELLALLRGRTDGWEFDHTDVVSDVVSKETEHPRVPVAVAAGGKALVAAYLAVHGLNNDEIADYLGVGSRTISQYITDFKQGER
jgi:hypothetical protein